MVIMATMLVEDITRLRVIIIKVREIAVLRLVRRSFRRRLRDCDMRLVVLSVIISYPGYFLNRPAPDTLIILA